jgi:hypothetical protein
MDFRPTFKNTDEINSIAESFLEKYHIVDEAIGDILAPAVFRGMPNFFCINFLHFPN